MEIITSRNNKKITEAVKLKDKKYRDAASLFCFEGYKLFCEALAQGISFTDIFVSESFLSAHEMPDIPYTAVTDGVYEKLSCDKAPDGIFCVAEKPHAEPKNDTRFMACSLGDPGNVGTLIRTCAAFDIGALILCDGCADPYSPKAVRSSMGAVFRQCIITGNGVQQIEELRKNGYTLCAATLSERSLEIGDIEITGKTCFAVGNEGHGLSKDIIDSCDKQVIIPITKDTESLNASAAAAILIWELSKNA